MMALDGFQGGESVLSKEKKFTAKTPRSQRVHRENRALLAISLSSSP
jgi:hypothetical protein